MHGQVLNILHNLYPSGTNDLRPVIILITQLSYMKSNHYFLLDHCPYYTLTIETDVEFPQHCH